MAALPKEAEWIWGGYVTLLCHRHLEWFLSWSCVLISGMQETTTCDRLIHCPALKDSSTRSTPSRAPASNPVRLSSLRLPAGAAGMISPYQPSGAGPVVLLHTRALCWQSCCCPCLQPALRWDPAEVGADRWGEEEDGADGGGAVTRWW